MTGIVIFLVPFTGNYHELQRDITIFQFCLKRVGSIGNFRAGRSAGEGIFCFRSIFLHTVQKNCLSFDGGDEGWHGQTEFVRASLVLGERLNYGRQMSLYVWRREFPPAARVVVL